MTTLLRILEPPTDSAIPDLAKVNFARDKPIVFILDEFDLFALHPRQSFVYSLLDIIQGNRRRGGVGVIGISARTVSLFSSLFLLYCRLTRSHVLRTV